MRHECDCELTCDVGAWLSYLCSSRVVCSLRTYDELERGEGAARHLTA